MISVLFLSFRPGSGKDDREVVHLSDPGPDGKLVVKSGVAALRCGGWWNPFAVNVSAENPEGRRMPGADNPMRLCRQCVKNSPTPIPDPPKVKPGKS